jgi:hypothetical protein
MLFLTTFGIGRYDSLKPSNNSICVNDNILKFNKFNDIPLLIVEEKSLILTRKRPTYLQEVYPLSASPPLL